MNRCINIDWLEVYCHELVDAQGYGIINQQYLENLGYIVTPRNYGTPTYHEMLTISLRGEREVPFIEVRRNPREDSQGGSFLHRASCHLRLCNQFCYGANPILDLCDFMLSCGYQFVSIKRIDIAMDFNKFDYGDNPPDVLRAYINEKLSKINQSRVSAHGLDTWDGRAWNSVRWGSPSSNIVTRFYNKTLELKESKMKSYIQDCWKLCGLDLDKNVWRVEFAIKAGAKGFKNIKSQDFYKMQLDFFNSRSKLLFIFHALCAKYFHFKYREQNADGSWKRKDRCRDKKLFNVTEYEKSYTPANVVRGKDPTRIDRIILNRCYKMQQNDCLDQDVLDAALTLAYSIERRLFGYIY